MITQDDLNRFGHAAYGERWQSPLARGLSLVSGRNVPQGLVANWLAGRPIPFWVAEALLKVAEVMAAARREDAIRLDECAVELRDRLLRAADLRERGSPG